MCQFECVGRGAEPNPEGDAEPLSPQWTTNTCCITSETRRRFRISATWSGLSAATLSNWTSACRRTKSESSSVWWPLKWPRYDEACKEKDPVFQFTFNQLFGSRPIVCIRSLHVYDRASITLGIVWITCTEKLYHWTHQFKSATAENERLCCCLAWCTSLTTRIKCIENNACDGHFLILLKPKLRNCCRSASKQNQANVLITRVSCQVMWQATSIIFNLLPGISSIITLFVSLCTSGIKTGGSLVTWLQNTWTTCITWTTSSSSTVNSWTMFWRTTSSTASSCPSTSTPWSAPRR